MAYTIEAPYVSVLPIASTDSGYVPPGSANIGTTTTIPSAPLRPGTIVRASDPTYGCGEFILLAGVASTAVGSVVTYNQSTFQTALAPVGTNLPQPIAIAMSANTASTTWGWYQISGIAVAAKSTTSLATGAAFGIGTIGLVGISSAGLEVQGALTASSAASSVSTIQLVMNRPHMQGRIT